MQHSPVAHAISLHAPSNELRVYMPVQSLATHVACCSQHSPCPQIAAAHAVVLPNFEEPSAHTRESQVGFGSQHSSSVQLAAVHVVVVVSFVSVAGSQSDNGADAHVSLTSQHSLVSV
jgi:hypothetical protein